jgi:hypothetical protein
VGATEVKSDSLSPNFDTPIPIPYYFERRQFVRFLVYDRDGSGGSDDDFLGLALTEVSCLMGAEGQVLILDLKNAQATTGKIIIRCEVQGEGTERMMNMQWGAKKLVNVDSFFDFWDKSDPYLKFIKIRPDGSKVTIHTTEVIQDNLSPTWRPFSVSLGKLANNDPKKEFVIECWDHEDDSPHQFIGEAQICL